MRIKNSGSSRILIEVLMHGDYCQSTFECVAIKEATISIQCGHRTWIKQSRAPIRVFSFFTTPSQRIVQTVEGTLDEAVSDCSNGSRKYRQAIPLQVGSCRFNLALHDVNGDRVGTYAENIVVPDLKQ